jgi:uncharacterized membrane protein YdbT with pleckstrin-like domain
LPKIATLHDRLDARLAISELKSADAADEIRFQPHALTEATRHVGTCVLTIVGILVLPLSLPWVFWRSRRTHYRIEQNRIRVDVDLLYRRRSTVLFDPIDHLESSRTFLNQLFKNRNVEVYTVGSGTVDLVLRALDSSERALAVIRGRMAG